MPRLLNDLSTLKLVTSAMTTTTRRSGALTLLTMTMMISALLAGRRTEAQEFFGCGGFIKSDAVIDFSKIEIKLYSQQGALKYATDCAPNNGYYLIPVYDKGDYVIKVSVCVLLGMCMVDLKTLCKR